MPELRVRAGVLTGSAAVEVGAEGEGMVLGDTVNTASRLQSIAAPGTVLVDDVTRRASEAAIAYEDAGLHEVKGREQPVHAWTALRVVAGVGGARRAAGLEAPFVGPRARAARRSSRPSSRAPRTDEPGWSRWSARPARASPACSGSSSSTWTGWRRVRWHQGRCLSYGEGVALLGAGRDDPQPGRHRRGGADRARRGRSCTRPWSSSSPTSASGGWWSRAWPTCSASMSARTPTVLTCSAAGGCSSSGWPPPSR